MPKYLKRKRAKKFAKKFELFKQLPPEMRMMVIDSMETAERCRFTRTSKSSEEEAKNSRKYIYSLEISGELDNDIRIHVVNGKYRYNMNTGYILSFCKENEKYYMIYLNSDSEELWRNELDSSSKQFNLYQYAGNYFEKLLQIYQNRIKKLRIQTFSKQLDISSLTNLEILKLNQYVEAIDLISKLRRPLKSLKVSGTETDQILSIYELSKVENILHIPTIKLNYQQFIELKAKNIRINIGTLSENDVLDFLRNWKNGTSWKELELCEFSLEGSRFDRKKLLDFLGKYDEGSFSFVDLGLSTQKRRGSLICSEINLAFSSHSTIDNTTPM